MYNTLYEALHRCPKGHEFQASANPFKPDEVSAHRCPQCLEEFLQANVNDGTQIGPTTKVGPQISYL
jgi:hypothetical protein